MEFMPLSLASIIQKRNTSAFHFHKKDIIKCAKGMAEAIAYLHHRKIIHRGIYFIYLFTLSFVIYLTSVTLQILRVVMYCWKLIQTWTVYKK